MKNKVNLVKLVILMWGVIPDLEFNENVENIPQPPNGGKIVLTGEPGEELFAQDNQKQVYHLNYAGGNFYWR